MDVIAFPYHDWRKSERESPRTRDGNLMREFGAHRAVRSLLVIDRPVSMAERVARRDPVSASGDRLESRHLAFGWDAALTRVSDRTTVLDISTPHLIAPVRDARGWWFDIFRHTRTHDAIDWAIAQSGLSGPSIIAWTPAVDGSLAHIAPGGWVFDSLDNWITHPILRRHASRATAAYRRILPSARAVFVPSEASRRELASFGVQVQVLPNGVDPERFGAPGDRPEDLPTPPIVGYVGKLGVRLDSDLVIATAESLPHVSFVFVGPVLEPGAVRSLRSRRNVCLLGGRRTEDIPSYLSAFDMAWIPHRVGEGETGGDLMKKYEYWAAGLQVIATPVADLEGWGHQLHLVRSSDDAAMTITGLLDGSISPKPTSIPDDRTWHAVAEILVRTLLQDEPRPIRGS